MNKNVKGNLLKNKVAIVTGGSMGIGRAIANKLAIEGAKLIIASRNRNDGEKVQEEINLKGGEALFIKVDISNYEQVKEMVEITISRFGVIDILINNAAIPGPVGFLYENSIEEWNKTIKANLNGTFYCCKEVLPYMIKQNYGRIINFSSKGGIIGHPLTSAYNSTKAGILNLTKTLSAEVASHNITVNCIMPGLIWTDMAKEGISKIATISGKSVEEFKKDCINNSPLKRLVDVNEVAEIVAFVSSQNSSCLTGNLFDLSGGGL